MHIAPVYFPVQFPVLKTERLILRSIGAEDRTGVYRLYSDQRVMQYRGEKTLTKNEECDELLFHWKKIFAQSAGIRWAIEWKQGNIFIGTAGIKKIEHVHHRGELGYELDPMWWNRGIMTEALSAIIKYAVNEINLHSLEANISPDNMPSRRVLEKLSFRNEGRFRENYFFEHWWDSEIWSYRKSIS
ncbi:MAG: GNAT family N-acetyltransferase [Bacteroidia bacterium]